MLCKVTWHSSMYHYSICTSLNFFFKIGPNNSNGLCWLCQRSLPTWPNCFTWWSHAPGNWAYVESVTSVLLLQTAAPSCLAYLDNRVVFVGSTLGDSQLVKVRVYRRDSEWGRKEIEFNVTWAFSARQMCICQPVTTVSCCPNDWYQATKPKLE